jgi:peptide chain release factor subunit 1
MFACQGAGLFEEIAVPETVREGVSMDATPWVWPLLAVLDEYRLARVMVIASVRAGLGAVRRRDARGLGGQGPFGAKA